MAVETRDSKAAGSARTETILYDRTGRIGIELDDRSGLPVALVDRTFGSERRLPVALSLRLDTEGREIDRQPFGMDYADLTVLTDVRRRDEPERAREHAARVVLRGDVRPRERGEED